MTNGPATGTKFSQLPASPANADQNTSLVGYPGAGNTDLRYSLAQVLAGITVGNLLHSDVNDQTLSGGWNVVSEILPTGPLQVDCGLGPLQAITNNGAFTIAAPVNDGSCIVQITNGATPGPVSFGSGFTVGNDVGDALTTNPGDVFSLFIWRVAGISHYFVVAGQGGPVGPFLSTSAPDQMLSGGWNVMPHVLPTGNLTVDCGLAPLQTITNNGAFTITAPATDGQTILQVTNGATAGNITPSGFSTSGLTGDIIDNTPGHVFTWYIWRINGVSQYFVYAAQGTAKVANNMLSATVVDQTLSGGWNVTTDNLGTVSSGSITIDCGLGPLQRLINNGNFTMNAPANDGSCIVQVTNGAAAGAITFGVGFTVGNNKGDTLTTNVGDVFSIYIWRVNGISQYYIFAAQGGASGAFLSTTANDQTLSGGWNVVTEVLTPGTFTVDCGKGPLQQIVNNGAFTFNAPTTDGQTVLQISNGATPGVITPGTGFSVGINHGDPFTTVSGNFFSVYIWRIGGVSQYYVVAAQGGAVPGGVDTTNFLSTLSNGVPTAVARNNADRWSDVICVTDYGAVGDNVHDDTQAIQNAVNALNTGASGFRGKILLPPGAFKVTAPIILPNTQTGTTTTPTFYIEGAGGKTGGTTNSGLIGNFNGFIFDDIPTGGNALHVGTYPTTIRNLVFRNTYAPARIYIKNLVGAAAWVRGATSISLTNASGGAGVLEGAIFISNTTFASGAVPGYVGFCSKGGVTAGSPTVFAIGDAAGAQIPSGGAADNIFAVQGFFANSTFTTASTTIVMNAANPGLDAGSYLVWDWSWVTSGASSVPKCLGISTLSTWTTAGTSITLTNASNFASRGANDLLVFTPMSGCIRRTGGECMTIEGCYFGGILSVWLDESNAPGTSLVDATPASFFTTIRNCVVTNGVGNSGAIGNIGIYGGQGTYIENCDIAACWNGVRLWEANTGLYGGRSETNCYGIILGGILHTNNSNTGNGPCKISNTEVEGTWAAAILNDNDSMRELVIEGVISSQSHANACYGLFINGGVAVTVTSSAFNYNLSAPYGGCWNPSFQGAGTPAAIYIANGTNPQEISFIDTQASSMPGTNNVNGTVPLSGPAWRLPTTAISGVEFHNCNNPPQIFTFANLPVPITSLTGQISADGTGAGATGTVLQFTAGSVTINPRVGSLITGATVLPNTFIVSHSVNGLNQFARVNNPQTAGSQAMTVYPMVDGDEYFISDCLVSMIGNVGTQVTAGGGTNHVKVRWVSSIPGWVIV